jgi:hypothetical protein
MSVCAPCAPVPDGEACTDDGNSCNKSVCKKGSCAHLKKPPTDNGNFQLGQSLQQPPDQYGFWFNADLLPRTCGFTGTLLHESVTVAYDSCNTGFTGYKLTVIMQDSNAYSDEIYSP